VLTRHIHTLKGTCALMGIDSVATFCHNLEDKLRESPDAFDDQDKERLRSLWQNLAQLRSRFAEESGIELSHEEHDAFVDELRRRVDYNVLATTCASWTFEPASKRLAAVRDQIERLSNRLGKAATDVICLPTKLRLPPSKWGPFWSTFAHVIRNTVDHGVETAEDRAAAGKSERARVEVGLTHEAQLVVVTVGDDGPGIDWPKMRQRAVELGLPHETQADLEGVLFSDGVSSRAETTSTSGRGVGLSAVREMMTKLGGTIELTSQTGSGTRLRLVLPQSMLFDDSPSPLSRLSNVPRWDSLAPGRGVNEGATLRPI
jgi:chemotaxis protein histidine kinase CheA